MALPRKPLFWAVSIGHLTIDLFNGSVPVLVTFLSAHQVAMTNTEIGLAVSGYQLLGGLSQPLAGYLADRTGGRWLGAGGLVWTVSLIMLSLIIAATTGQFALMVVPLVLAALGSGAFHPVGAMHAADTDRVRTTSNLSIFFFMGQFGGGLGPAIAGFILDRAATHNALFTQSFPAFAGAIGEGGSIAPFLTLALVAIPGAVLMSAIIPGARTYAAAHSERKAAAKNAPRRHYTRAAMGVFVLIVLLRALVNPGSVSFIPRLFQMRGWSAAEYGLIASAFWIGGGLTGLLFGYLADRYGSRVLIAASLILTAPAVFGLSLLDGAGAFVLALAVGAFSGGSHSLLVSMAHQLLPVGRGLASGAALGFIFATGALGVLVIGGVSDRIGLTTAFQIISAVTLITGLLTFLLPADRPARAPQTAPSAEIAGAHVSGD
jgi:FSR family fosmidomycin resistance protein-like MFS transporter